MADMTIRDALNRLGVSDDLARKAKRQMMAGDADTHRRWAEEWERDGQHYDAVRSLVNAALLEADLPEPIQVGHLARSVVDDATFLVLALGRRRALLETKWGWETSRPIAYLAYAGPKPEGWGEQ